MEVILKLTFYFLTKHRLSITCHIPIYRDSVIFIIFPEIFLTDKPYCEKRAVRLPGSIT